MRVVLFQRCLTGFFLNRRLEGLVSKTCIIFLGGGFKYVLLSPLFGEDSHFDDFFLQMAGLKPPTSFTLNIKEDDEPPQIDSKKGQNTILGLWDRCGTFLLGQKRSFVAMHGLKKLLPSKFGKFYLGFIFAKDLTFPMGPGIVILPLIRVDIPIKRIHYGETSNLFFIFTPWEMIQFGISFRWVGSTTN